MGRPLVNPGTLYWTGQHWMVYLRTPGSDEDSGRVSVWHTHYSESGEGTVIYVDLPGYQAACTDNREVASFIDHWVRSMPGPYQTDHVIDAEIHREGDIRHSPSWVVQSEDHSIVTTWTDIQSPVILEAPAPRFREDRDVYSYLFFSSGSILFDGTPIEGDPYIRDIWKPSIGGDRSSCVIALSETFVDIP